MAEVYMTTYKDKKKPPYSLRPSLNGEQNYKIVKILEIPPYHYPIIMDISMDEVMNIICNEFEGEDNSEIINLSEFWRVHHLFLPPFFFSLTCFSKLLIL